MVYYRFGPLSVRDVGKNASNISSCPDGVQWIYTVLGDCVETPREQASAYLGIASIITWMLVGIPQIIKNFRHIDGMAGVSFFLLFQWAGGDVTNLIGAFLTKQLQAQIYLAIYFVVTDAVLMMEYTWFRVRSYRRKKESARAGSDPTPRLILCLMGLFAFSHTFGDQISSALSSSLSQSPSLPGSSIPVSSQDVGNIAAAGRFSSRSLLSHSDNPLPQFGLSQRAAKGVLSQGPLNQWVVTRNEHKSDGSSSNLAYQVAASSSGGTVKHASTTFWHNEMDIIGYAIGILSSIFYLGSRTAQIYKNRKTQSTDGLAVFTFILAVVGNLTYGGQILVRSLEKEFILEKTPWLIGSLGVIALDCTLLFQFYYYNKRKRNIDEMRRTLVDKEYTINADDVPNVAIQSSGGDSSYAY